MANFNTQSQHICKDIVNIDNCNKKNNCIYYNNSCENINIFNSLNELNDKGTIYGYIINDIDTGNYEIIINIVYNKNTQNKLNILIKGILINCSQNNNNVEDLNRKDCNLLLNDNTSFSIKQPDNTRIFDKSDFTNKISVKINLNQFNQIKNNNTISNNNSSYTITLVDLYDNRLNINIINYIQGEINNIINRTSPLNDEINRILQLTKTKIDTITDFL